MDSEERGVGGWPPCRQRGLGANNEEGIARLEIEQNVHFPFPFLHSSYVFVFVENAVPASGLGREKRLELSHAPSLWCVH